MVQSITQPKSPFNLDSLAGKVALVTGGGRGLGAAICRVFANAGLIPIVADIQGNLAENIAQELKQNGQDAMAIQIDITNPKDVENAIDKIIAKYGKIDVLVNNAGCDLTVSIEEMPLEEWEKIINVNLTAPFILSKAVFSQMKQQGEGAIINIASTASKRAWANASAYHASKWGLLGFSHALHVEGRPHNIKVTAILAGGMRTPFLLDRFPDLDINKLQDPANVAQTVLYMLLQPLETVIPEVMVLPLTESSWP